MSASTADLSDRLWAARQWAVFAARTTAFGIASCIGGPLTKGAFSLYCMRRWCIDSLAGLGIAVETRDLGRVRAAGPSVIVVNHQSSLDILVLGAVLEVDYKWAAKRSVFRVPFLGWHLALAGHIPVDRGRRHALRALEGRFDRVLRSDQHLLLFPEGTRSVDGELKPFKVGAFVAAVRNDVPVVPVVIDGTASLMEKGSWRLAAGSARRVRVRALPPIWPRSAGAPNDRVALLREEAHRAMAAALDEMRGRAAAPDALAARAWRRPAAAGPEGQATG